MVTSNLNPAKTTAWRGALLTLGYLALALAMTWPLVLHSGSFVMAGLEDGSMSIWNLWWMKFSLLDLGQSPMHTTYLFFPDGAGLIFHSLPKVLGLISIPLQYMAGFAIAYNVIFLLTFVLTALTTYWLAFHLLGQRLPAFLAGAFFAFSPFRWDQLGHLQLLSTMLIPVYILLVIKGREGLAKGGWRPWIYFSLAGLALAITAYDTEYYSVFLIIFSALYFVFYVPLKGDLPAIRRWGLLLAGLLVSGIIFAALFSPMLLAAARELAANGDYVSFPAGKTAAYGADLLAFLVPHSFSQFLGSFFDYAPNTDTTFLGWMAVLLALVGLWRFRRRRDVWLWGLTALLSAALALGPDLKIMGRVTGLPGPYLLITHVPVISAVRVPARFAAITMLAVAILAGYGLSALFGALKNRGWEKAAVPAAAALVLLGIFIEYKPSYHLTPTGAPPVYSQIAASDLPGSVITLPLGWEAGDDLTGTERTYTEIFQMEHERPMVGGMMARAPKDLLFRGIYTPVLDFLADPEALEPSDLDRDSQAIAGFKERYQVAFIVAHKQMPEIYYKGSYMRFPPDLTPEAIDRVDRYVTTYLGMEKFAETEEVVAYRRR